MVQEDMNINMSFVAKDMSGIVAAQTNLNQLVGVFSNVGEGIARNVGAIDAAVATAGVSLGILSTQAARAYGEFERGQAIVQTVSGSTNAEMQILGHTAQQFSSEFRMGIDDVNEGLTTLGRAGLTDVNNQIETLRQGFSLAKIEGMNLATALEEIVQTTSLLGGDIQSSDFGMDTEKVTNMLVGTSLSGPLDVNDVVQTLKYVGGTAAAAGANLSNEDLLYDLMGTTSAFAQKGVVGSMAGTALRAFLSKPATQDSSVWEALKEIGLEPYSLWEDGQQEMKPISEQIRIIRQAMKDNNKSTMDQLEIWGKLVGTKMGQQMMKLDENTIQESTAKIREKASAETLANRSMQNFASQQEEIMKSLETIWRNYGKTIADVLSPILEIMKPIVDFLANDSYGSKFAIWGLVAVVNSLLGRALGSIKEVLKFVWELVSKTREQVGLTKQEAVTTEDLLVQNKALTNELQQQAAAKKQIATFSNVDETHMRYQTGGNGFGKTLYMHPDAVNALTPNQRTQNGLLLNELQALKEVGNTNAAIKDEFKSVVQSYYQQEVAPFLAMGGDKSDFSGYIDASVIDENLPNTMKMFGGDYSPELQYHIRNELGRQIRNAALYGKTDANGNIKVRYIGNMIADAFGGAIYKSGDFSGNIFSYDKGLGQYGVLNAKTGTLDTRKDSTTGYFGVSNYGQYEDKPGNPGKAVALMDPNKFISSDDGMNYRRTVLDRISRDLSNTTQGLNDINNSIVSATNVFSQSIPQNNTALQTDAATGNSNSSSDYKRNWGDKISTNWANNLNRAADKLYEAARRLSSDDLYYNRLDRNRREFIGNSYDANGQRVSGNVKINPATNQVYIKTDDGKWINKGAQFRGKKDEEYEVLEYSNYSKDSSFEQRKPVIVRDRYNKVLRYDYNNDDYYPVTLNDTRSEQARYAAEANRRLYNTSRSVKYNKLDYAGNEFVHFQENDIDEDKIKNLGSDTRLQSQATGQKGHYVAKINPETNALGLAHAMEDDRGFQWVTWKWYADRGKGLSNEELSPFGLSHPVINGKEDRTVLQHMVDGVAKDIVTNMERNPVAVRQAIINQRDTFAGAQRPSKQYRDSISTGVNGIDIDKYYPYGYSDKYDTYLAKNKEQTPRDNTVNGLLNTIVDNLGTIKGHTKLLNNIKGYQDNISSKVSSIYYDLNNFINRNTYTSLNGDQKNNIGLESGKAALARDLGVYDDNMSAMRLNIDKRLRDIENTYPSTGSGRFKTYNDSDIQREYSQLIGIKKELDNAEYALNGRPFGNQFRDKFLAIDTENTGLDPSKHRMVQVGVQKFENGIATTGFEKNINQPDEIARLMEQEPDSPALRMLHNIDGLRSNNTFANGVSELDALVDLFNMFKEEDVLSGATPLVGQNITYDMSMLREAVLRNEEFLKAAGYSINDFNNIRFIDTQTIASRGFNFSDNKLGTIARNLGIDFNGTQHTALADADVTGRSLIEMSNIIDADIPRDTLQHIINIENLLKRQFGGTRRRLNSDSQQSSIGDESSTINNPVSGFEDETFISNENNDSQRTLGGFSRVSFGDGWSRTVVDGSTEYLHSPTGDTYHRTFGESGWFDENNERISNILPNKDVMQLEGQALEDAIAYQNTVIPKHEEYNKLMSQREKLWKQFEEVRDIHYAAGLRGDVETYEAYGQTATVLRTKVEELDNQLYEIMPFLDIDEAEERRLEYVGQRKELLNQISRLETDLAVNEGTPVDPIRRKPKPGTKWRYEDANQIAKNTLDEAIASAKKEAITFMGTKEFQERFPTEVIPDNYMNEPGRNNFRKPRAGSKNYEKRLEKYETRVRNYENRRDVLAEQFGYLTDLRNNPAYNVFDEKGELDDYLLTNSRSKSFGPGSRSGKKLLNDIWRINTRNKEKIEVSNGYIEIEKDAAEIEQETREIREKSERIKAKLTAKKAELAAIEAKIDKANQISTFHENAPFDPRSDIFNLDDISRRTDDTIHVIGKYLRGLGYDMTLGAVGDDIIKATVLGSLEDMPLVLPEEVQKVRQGALPEQVLSKDIIDARIADFRPNAGPITGVEAAQLAMNQITQLVIDSGKHERLGTAMNPIQIIDDIFRGTVSNPYTLLSMKGKFNTEEEARNIAQFLNPVFLKDVMSGTIDRDNWTLDLDPNKLLEFGLEPDWVFETLQRSFGNIPMSISDNQIKFNPTNDTDKHQIKNWISEAQISGMTGIKPINLDSDVFKYYNEEGVEEWKILAQGSNVAFLDSLLGADFLLKDAFDFITTDFRDVENVRGVEAARQVLTAQLRATLQSLGLNISDDIIKAITSMMTASGKVVSVSDIVHQRNNPLERAAFEDSMRVMYQASLHGETAHTTPTVNTIIGQETPPLLETLNADTAEKILYEDNNLEYTRPSIDKDTLKGIHRNQMDEYNTMLAKDTRENPQRARVVAEQSNPIPPAAFKDARSLQLLQMLAAESLNKQYEIMNGTQGALANLDKRRQLLMEKKNALAAKIESDAQIDENDRIQLEELESRIKGIDAATADIRQGKAAFSYAELNRSASETLNPNPLYEEDLAVIRQSLQERVDNGKMAQSTMDYILSGEGTQRGPSAWDSAGILKEESIETMASRVRDLAPDEVFAGVEDLFEELRRNSINDYDAHQFINWIGKQFGMELDGNGVADPTKIVGGLHSNIGAKGFHGMGAVPIRMAGIMQVMEALKDSDASLPEGAIPMPRLEKTQGNLSNPIYNITEGLTNEVMAAKVVADTYRVTHARMEDLLYSTSIIARTDGRTDLRYQTEELQRLNDEFDELFKIDIDGRRRSFFGLDNEDWADPAIVEEFNKRVKEREEFIRRYYERMIAFREQIKEEDAAIIKDQDKRIHANSELGYYHSYDEDGNYLGLTPTINRDGQFRDIDKSRKTILAMKERYPNMPELDEPKITTIGDVTPSFSQGSLLNDEVEKGVFTVPEPNQVENMAKTIEGLSDRNKAQQEKSHAYYMDKIVNGTLREQQEAYSRFYAKNYDELINWFRAFHVEDDVINKFVSEKGVLHDNLNIARLLSQFDDNIEKGIAPVHTVKALIDELDETRNPYRRMKIHEGRGDTPESVRGYPFKMLAENELLSAQKGFFDHDKFVEWWKEASVEEQELFGRNIKQGVYARQADTPNLPGFDDFLTEEGQKQFGTITNMLKFEEKLEEIKQIESQQLSALERILSEGRFLNPDDMNKINDEYFNSEEYKASKREKILQNASGEYTYAGGRFFGTGDVVLLDNLNDDFLSNLANADLTPFRDEFELPPFVRPYGPVYRDPEAVSKWRRKQVDGKNLEDPLLGLDQLFGVESTAEERAVRLDKLNEKQANKVKKYQDDIAENNKRHAEQMNAKYGPGKGSLSFEQLRALPDSAGKDILMKEYMSGLSPFQRFKARLGIAPSTYTDKDGQVQTRGFGERIKDSTGALGKLGGAIGSVTNLMGGPMMAAMTIFQGVMQAYSAVVEKESERITKIQTETSEAQERYSQAESNFLTSKERADENFSNVSEDDKETAIEEALKEGRDKDVTMQDLRLLTDENLELTESEQLNKDLTALEANTRLLYTSQLQMTAALRNEANVEDDTGQLGHYGTQADFTEWYEGSGIKNSKDEYGLGDILDINAWKTKFGLTDKGEEYLEDIAQSSENGLQFTTRIKNAEDLETDFEKLAASFDKRNVGGNDISTIFGGNKGLYPQYNSYWNDIGTHNGGYSATQLAKLGKQYDKQLNRFERKNFRFEFKNGRLVLKNIQNIDKKFANLGQRLGISKIAAQQLVMLHTLNDLYQVAETQVKPELINQTQGLYSQLATSSGIHSNTGSSVSVEQAMNQGLAVISQQLSQVIVSTANEAAVDSYNAVSDTPVESVGELNKIIKDGNKSSDEYKNAVKAMDTKYQTQAYQAKYYERLNAGDTPAEAMKKAQKSSEEYLKKYGVENGSYWKTHQKYTDIAKEYESPTIGNFMKRLASNIPGFPSSGYSDYNATDIMKLNDEVVKNNPDVIKYLMNLTNTINESNMDAEDAADDETGGSGKGGGGKDYDNNNRQRYVQLAICNKKAIPKLNVNLFKKAPSFTVMNKNFKLRDIKINTADKAKNIESAVKNAIIDVQERSDPKIIQDEEAEYDPVGATDGDNLPTGTTQTNNN